MDKLSLLHGKTLPLQRYLVLLSSWNVYYFYVCSPVNDASFAYFIIFSRKIYIYSQHSQANIWGYKPSLERNGIELSRRGKYIKREKYSTCILLFCIRNTQKNRFIFLHKILFIMRSFKSSLRLTWFFIFYLVLNVYQWNKTNTELSIDISVVKEQ